MKSNLRTNLSKIFSVFTAAALLVTLPSLAPTQTVSAVGIGVNASTPASLSFTTAAPSTEYWPMFGHDSAHTSRSAVNGPNTADLAWTYPDPVSGDPIVGPDGTIYGIS